MAGAITVDMKPEDFLLGFPILLPGTYVSLISDVELATSKKAQEAGATEPNMAVLKFTPQGRVKVQTKDTETGESKVTEIDGRELLKSQCVFQGNCARQTLELQVATRTPNIGFRKTGENSGQFFPEEYIQFKGKVVKVVVENEDYEGRAQAKVKALYPA
jgi:hypothetical protein